MNDDTAQATPDLSGFRLKRPCLHCPFRNDGTRIRFRCRERALEIEEQAYRQGFPCHETADYREDPEGRDDGFVFGEKSSFCIGYVIMRLKNDGGVRVPVARHRQRRATADRIVRAPRRLVEGAGVRDRRRVLRGQREREVPPEGSAATPRG